MARPADLPFTDHFQALPCGTRAKYSAGGCRCLRCRAANSRYETARAAARKRGEWNGLVSTDAVRAHLITLSRQGVGYKTVADVARVSKTSLLNIRQGRKAWMRALAARRVLDVDRQAIADAALVPASKTLARLDRLLREGFTRRELARRLGSTAASPALRIRGPKILARTALKVERFYNAIMAGA